MIVAVSEKAIISKYLGVPYKHRGRDLKGLDCYGLIICIYKDLGFKLWDIEEEYDENWSWKGKNHFIENYHQQWRRIEVPDVFDVVLFSNSKGIANHGGVVLSEGRFIHTCKQGTIISRLSDPGWRKRIEGFYRLKERDDYRKIYPQSS